MVRLLFVFFVWFLIAVAECYEQDSPSILPLNCETCHDVAPAPAIAPGPAFIALPLGDKFFEALQRCADVSGPTLMLVLLDSCPPST